MKIADELDRVRPCVGLTPLPLLAQRLRLQQSCPLWRALRIELIEWGAGRSITRMPPSPPTALSPQDARIDPLALVAMLDDAFSNALASLVPIEVGMSTLDLRMGFAHAGPPEGAVVAETHARMLDDHCATSDVLMRDQTGMVVATGTALFTVAGYPGGTLPDFSAIGHYDPSTSPSPYSTLIGLTQKDGEVALAGDSPHVVGWETSQALHGGVIGALLMEACRQRGQQGAPSQRLATLYIRYLRPGSATKALLSSTEIERQGRSASYVSARCFHEEGRTVATAHATFVAS